MEEEITHLNNGDTVILFGGTNNTSLKHWGLVVDKLSKILLLAKVRILLTEIPYILSSCVKKQYEIKQCNSTLLSLSLKFNVPYLMFSHCLGHKYFSADQLHLNKSGKIVMCNKLKSWFPHVLHCRPNTKRTSQAGTTIAGEHGLPEQNSGPPSVKSAKPSPISVVETDMKNIINEFKNNT